MIAENVQTQASINWLGSLAAFSNIALLILTFISVKYAYQVYIHQKDRAKKDASCSLAKCFADYIIDQITFISNCLRASECTNIIEEIFPINSLILFDEGELYELTKNNKENFEKLKLKMDSMDPVCIAQAMLIDAKTFQEAKQIRDHIGLMMLDDTSMITKAAQKLGERELGLLREEKQLLESFYAFKYDSVLTELQNRLEWFALTCRYGLADEEMIYQSLHTVFLHTVWSVSYYISIRNVNADDKLYTNIIWLFNHWRNRSIEIKEGIKSNEQAAEEQLKKVKRGSSTGYAGKSLD